MGTKKTPAQHVQSIMNRYKIRLGDDFDKGDRLANESMKQEIAVVRKKAEEIRISKLSPKNYLKELTEKAYGGELPEYGGLNPVSQFLNTRLGKTQSSGIDFDPNSVNSFNRGSAWDSLGLNRGTDPTSVFGGDMNDLGNSATGTAGDTPFKSRVPWMGAAAGVIGSLMGNRKLDLPEYEAMDYNPTNITANLVDYSRGREGTVREREDANALINANARGTGSQSGLMDQLLAGTTATQEVAGQQINASLENEGNVNAQIKNQVGAQNAQLDLNAAQMNMQNEMYANRMNRENMMINADRKDARISGVINNVKGYAKDRTRANQYDQMINVMAPDNYKAVAGKDSSFRKFMGFSPDFLMKHFNTKDKSSDSK